uniref:Reverse transcriptase/retrotransposon-derived protein RNase H-like domain-containing protein n=1 Tax=Aquila chrysaetos chrysaetos TaxID=223781 RepID=A0A663E205_AQUCH
MDCYEIAKSLHEATRNEEIEPIAWGTEREKVFYTLKAALLSAPALGPPDYSKPFRLYCDEAKGVAKGVLVQALGPHERPVAYFSSTLDPVTKGTPFCIRAIAAAAEMVEKTRTIVLGHPLTVCVPHKVEILLLLMDNRSKTF